MARRHIPMIEVNELIFRWHRGDPIAQIARSLGTDRKTVRKYVRMAKAAGIERGVALPAEHEVAAKLASKRVAVAKQLPTPGKDRLVPYHDRIKKWADEPAITIKQIRRLLKEQHPELSIGYTCLREYVQLHFRPKTGSTIKKDRLLLTLAS